MQEVDLQRYVLPSLLTQISTQRLPELSSSAESFSLPPGQTLKLKL